MTNIMKLGATMLSTTRASSMSESIVYKRAALSVTIDATIGRVGADQGEVEGVIVDLEGVDFILAAATLILGSLTLPQEGDTIEYDPGTGVVVYEVRPNDLDQLFRNCDEFGLDIRVHTKRLGA